MSDEASPEVDTARFQGCQRTDVDVESLLRHQPTHSEDLVGGSARVVDLECTEVDTVVQTAHAFRRVRRKEGLEVRHVCIAHGYRESRALHDSSQKPWIHRRTVDVLGVSREAVARATHLVEEHRRDGGVRREVNVQVPNAQLGAAPTQPESFGQELARTRMTIAGHLSDEGLKARKLDLVAVRRIEQELPRVHSSALWKNLYVGTKCLQFWMPGLFIGLTPREDVQVPSQRLLSENLVEYEGLREARKLLQQVGDHPGILSSACSG